jgi:hypothetical protein
MTATLTPGVQSSRIRSSRVHTARSGARRRPCGRRSAITQSIRAPSSEGIDGSLSSISVSGSCRLDARGATKIGVNFRNGSIASLWQRAGHFRSTSVNGRRQTAPACRVGARCRLVRRSKRGAIRSPFWRKRARAHSGNPAFRRPSMYSFAFDTPPRAINADMVKSGSTSSRRAAASPASASRPRWAKADARQR